MNKNFYYILSLVAMQTAAFGQENFSFEENEGYALGTINNQNEWEVTETRSSGYLNNQIITAEKASAGERSFKNGNQVDFDFQYLPMFGASKEFETPYDYQNFTISYDVFVSQRNGSDFEFNLYGIIDDEFVPVAGIGMENRGYIYITANTDYDFVYADAGEGWPINAWNNIKIEVTADEVKYYLNNNLIYTIDNFTETEIKGITLLHNNYGGDAYYDNFKINEASMNTSDIKNGNIAVYPNPVKNHLFVDTKDQITKIEIYNVLGQLEQSSSNLKEVNTSNFKSGNYVAKITLSTGKTITKKFIKK